MNRHTRTSIAEQWQHGVQLWEQDGAYFQAMQVWEQALQAAGWSVSDDEEDTTTTTTTARDKQESTWLPRPQSNQEQDLEVNQTINPTPLLLFLAGCFLDAADYVKARQYCRNAWLCNNYCLDKVNRDDNRDADPCSHQRIDYNQRILAEYMASFEEDPDEVQPWIKSFQLVRQALEQQQQQSPETNGTWILWRTPYQRPAFYYPIPDATSYQGVCPRDQHPSWCRALEDQFAMVRDEFWQAMSYSSSSSSSLESLSKPTVPSHWPQVGHGTHRDGAGAHDGSVVNPQGDWREWVLLGSGARDHGHFSRTRAWLQEHVPGACTLAQQGGGEVIASVLAPGTHIAPHCASTNLRWTAHLGLQCPAGARIRVAEEWQTWQEGKVLVFDDSYEHEVRNENKDQLRAVLLIRFWHPGIPTEQQHEALQQALEWKRLDEERRYHPPQP